MGLPPISFTGFSDFSESFQAVLERTFEVASLPIQHLQSEQAVLSAEQQALGDLAAAVQDLEGRFQTLGFVGAKSAVTATSTDESVAVGTVTGTPEQLSFNIEVTTAASAAQEISLSGLSDTTATGLTADGVYSLTVGSTTTEIDLLTIGSGRTAGTSGAATPSPPVSVQVDFSNGLDETITAELDSFFVASDAPSGAGAGDTITINFVSEDSSIDTSITTAPLAGTESTAEIATLLNDEIALDADLAGKLTFSDEGGKLKLVVSDTAGQGFTFTLSATGTTVSGLESGGTAGGHSAEEIAAALNAQVALNQNLTDAGVAFTAVGGEVKVTGSLQFDISASDNAQGTGFASGLAGIHTVGAFDNTLEGLRDFINSQPESLGVKASILNTSSDPDAPEFHLTVTALETGANTLLLQDSSMADLLTATNQGTNAVFTVDGLAVDTPGNTITDFSTGLSLTIAGPGTTTVSVGTHRAEISNALADIATDYNAVAAELAKHIGEDAGALSGNPIIRQAQATLRGITGFLGGGAIRSMVEVGLELDDAGLMSFNSLTFNSLTDGQLDDVLSFIGNTTAGFAGNGRTGLQGLGDPVNGRIQISIDFLKESDAALAKQIDAAQERVDRLISQLEAQFGAAERVLARLTSQQNLLTRLFDAFEAQLIGSR